MIDIPELIEIVFNYTDPLTLYSLNKRYQKKYMQEVIDTYDITYDNAITGCLSMCYNLFDLGYRTYNSLFYTAAADEDNGLEMCKWCVLASVSTDASIYKCALKNTVFALDICKLLQYKITIGIRTSHKYNYFKKDCYKYARNNSNLSESLIEWLDNVD